MNRIKLFEGQKVRKHWDEEKQEWYFSVVDVCGVLSEQPSQARARNYWKVLKSRLSSEGSELVTNCNRLKMRAEDGKMRDTDALNAKGIFRLIQSIPSPRAEPFKMWLAQVGHDRLDEIADPEIGIKRNIATYRKKGYGEAWTERRMQSIDIRNSLEDEWKRSEIKEGLEYALLTDEISKAWSGLTTREYKGLKNLKKESLRDNMTTFELLMTMVSEEATKTISKQRNPKGFEEGSKIAIEGGSVARVARERLEESTGQKVVTSLSFKNIKQLTNKKKKKN